MSKSSDFAASIGAKLTEPSVPITDKSFKYVPSWQHVPRTTWQTRLGGHFGMVELKDMVRMTWDARRALMPEQPHDR